VSLNLARGHQFAGQGKRNWSVLTEDSKNTSVCYDY
jgi:hypothetical protein